MALIKDGEIIIAIEQESKTYFRGGLPFIEKFKKDYTFSHNN